MGQGGGTDVRTDGRTDRFPLCSTGLRPLRGRCPKTARNSCMWWTDGPTDLTTDTARCIVACPQLKSAKKSFSAPTHPYVIGTSHKSSLVLSYADILWISFYKFLLFKELLIYKLFHSLWFDISIHSYKHHDFLKQIIVLFVTKLHRILLNSGKSVETLGPKQKRKMKEFWKKENGHLYDFYFSILPK